MPAAKAWTLIVIVALILLACAGLVLQASFVFQIPFYLAVGWFPFLRRVLPEVSVSPGGIVIGLVALGVSLGLCHAVTAWLWNSFHHMQPWRPRWTIIWYLLVLLTFAGGICLVCITHQSYWIASSPEPFVDSSWRIDEKVRLSSLGSQMRVIRAALALYRDQHQGRFPSLAQMSDWSAMLKMMDASGQPVKSGGVGPYLQTAPVNPFTEESRVVSMQSPNELAGWAYDEATGEVRAIVTRFHVRYLEEKDYLPLVVVVR